MTRVICLILSAGILSACAGKPEFVERLLPDRAAPAGNGDLRLGSGYRGGDDPCVRVGQTEFTAPYLRSDEDLVGCPIAFDGRPDFIRGLDAREAVRTEDWVVYTVPLGNAAVTEFGIPTPITGGETPITGG